jgi:hypothetical protein
MNTHSAQPKRWHAIRCLDTGLQIPFDTELLRGRLYAKVAIACYEEDLRMSARRMSAQRPYFARSFPVVAGETMPRIESIRMLLFLRRQRLEVRILGRAGLPKRTLMMITEP